MPGDSIRVITATCPGAELCTTESGLFKPLATKLCLPAGLLVSPAEVTVVSGIVHIPIVNVSNVDVLLQLWTPSGPTSTVSLPGGVAEAVGSGQATVSAQLSSVAPQSDCLPDVDLPTLNNMEQEKGSSLLGKYVGVFSAHGAMRPTFGSCWIVRWSVRIESPMPPVV